MPKTEYKKWNTY